jgi:hypothetical protein
MAAEKNRFSDYELEEFKILIQNKLNEANEDYKLLIGSLSHSDDHGTDDTGRSFNMMEDGSETLSREEVAQLAARQEKFIQSPFIKRMMKEFPDLTFDTLQIILVIASSHTSTDKFT